MPAFPLPRRPAREPDEPLLDMILDRQSLPPDAPQDAHALADRLAGLAGPAEPGVLPGEAAARSAFARAAPPAGSFHRSHRRQHRAPTPRARVAAVLLAVTAGLGGAVAAYAEALPGPVQNFAHHVLGVPPKPHGTARPGSSTAGRQAHAVPGTATPGAGNSHATATATAGTAITPCPPGTKASFRWHYSTSGNPGGPPPPPGGWSGTQAAVCPSSLTMGPQAMDGDLKVSPGTTLMAGYDFTVPGNRASLSLTVRTPQVVFAVACASGATPSASTLTVPMPTRTYAVSGAPWYPGPGQGGPQAYQGSVTVPDLCGGGQLRLNLGGTFTASTS